MNRRLHESDPVADEEACLWAARLEGSDLTSGQKAELEAWLAAAPSHRELLSGYCSLSAAIDRQFQTLADSASSEAPAEAPTRPRRSAWAALAGAAAAAALAAGGLWYARPGVHTESLATPAGQRGSFTLSDGSRVELNANTSITVETGRAERRIHLSNGEAFFVVSKDKARPFIVETPAGSVRVTGTIFNVLTEAASQLDVTVVEGSVQVRLDGVAAGSPGSADLVAGGVLDAEGGAVTVGSKSAADIDDALAWRRGNIVCNAMPVSEALARFAHYHGIVMTATAGAAAKRAGGQYSLGNLDEFLGYLRQSLDLRVDRSADGSVRVSLPGGG